jgi:hypothetical protein
MSNENEKCPKCGAGVLYTGRTPELHRIYTKYTCNYVAYEDGGQDEAYNCIRRQLTAAKLRINDLGEAMREFCKRVEAGEVQSVRTYAKFKALLGDKEEPTDEH